MIDSLKYNGMSEENTEGITNSNSNFAQTFVNHHALLDIDFNGRWIINDINIPKKVINTCISYKLNP